MEIKNLKKIEKILDVIKKLGNILYWSKFGGKNFSLVKKLVYQAYLVDNFWTWLQEIL
jgi:hypothetical protein